MIVCVPGARAAVIAGPVPSRPCSEELQTSCEAFNWPSWRSLVAPTKAYVWPSTSSAPFAGVVIETRGALTGTRNVPLERSLPVRTPSLAITSKRALLPPGSSVRSTASDVDERRVAIGIVCLPSGL